MTTAELIEKCKIYADWVRHDSRAHQVLRQCENRLAAQEEMIARVRDIVTQPSYHLPQARLQMIQELFADTEAVKP